MAAACQDCLSDTSVYPGVETHYRKQEESVTFSVNFTYAQFSMLSIKSREPREKSVKVMVAGQHLSTEVFLIIYIYFGLFYMT